MTIDVAPRLTEQDGSGADATADAWPVDPAAGDVAPAAASTSNPTPGRERSGRRRRLLRRSGRVARRATVIVVLLVAWQLASMAQWLDRSTLAPPTEVWNTFVDLFWSGELAANVGVSFRRVAIGLAIGVTVATILGLIAGLSRVGEELIDAPLQMLRAMPFLGLMPLLLVWLGLGEGLKVGLVVIGVIFPVYLNLHKGIRSVDPRFGELASTCGVGRWGVIRRVLLPGAMPQFLIGLRFSLGIAWLSLVVGETVNPDQGIGYLMMKGREYLRTDLIVLGLVIYAILGLLTEAGVRLIERRALPWRREFVA
jgi:sulfonate transport system permease protein